MSDNLVAALRGVAANAADEIEHLRAEVERLREGSPTEKMLDDIERLRSDNVMLVGEIEYLRREIERLRASPERPYYKPEELVGALQDRIHPTSGRLIAAHPLVTSARKAMKEAGR